MKTTSILLALAVGLTTVIGINASAKDTTKNSQFSTALKGVPVASLPAKAAELVKQAKAEERQATTIGIMKAVVESNPSLTAEVVAAIAKASPDMASLAASTAAILQPKQAAAIVKAAVEAVPSQVSDIVQAVCRAIPSDYRTVAIAASEAAPTSSKEIVAAVSSAIPSMKSSIEQSMKLYGGSVPSVAIVLDQTRVVGTRSSPSLVSMSPSTIYSPYTPRPVGKGPPNRPVVGGTTDILPSSGGATTNVTHDYAAP